MGDRVYVYLTIPTQCEELAMTVIKGFHLFEKWRQHDGESECCFSEVNSGDLTFLPDLLRLGIPYESFWETGCDYGAGTEYGRFTSEGECKVFSVFDDDRNPDIRWLMNLTQTPSELVAYLHKFVAEHTPLPWDNQVEYGKIYRTVQLITT